MPYIPNPTFDDYDSILAYLEHDAFRWNTQTALGTNIVLTYSFPQGTDLPEGGGANGVTDFAGFSEAQQTSFRTVIAQVEFISGIRFVEIDSGGMVNMMIGLEGSGASGYADLPGLANGNSPASDLVMIYTEFETAGTFSYMVTMHELGHSLGLAHTHEGYDVPNQGDDIYANSVMTYDQSTPVPSTFRSFDIAALQHLYGTNANSSNWDVSVLNSGVVQTITSNGRDKMMGVSGDNLIKAGRGSDVILGREGDDNLQGQGGHDDLYGEDGNDFLVGGAGNDDMYGGDDNDRLYGGKGKDVLIGSSGRDILKGGADEDIFVFSAFDLGAADRIMDFQQGTDFLDFTAVAEFGIAFQHVVQSDIANNRHHLIDVGGIKVVFVNDGGLTLTSDDFLF